MDAHAVDLVGVEDAAHEEEAEALPEVVPHQLGQVVRVPLEVPVDGVAHARGVRPLRAHLVIATVVRLFASGPFVIFQVCRYSVICAMKFFNKRSSLYSTCFAQVSAPLPLAAASEAASMRAKVMPAKSMAENEDFGDTFNNKLLIKCNPPVGLQNFYNLLVNLLQVT